MSLTLADRVAALAAALDAGEGRLPAAVVDAGRAVLAHVAARGGLSAEHTVVALAGATGSGKSSLFNALVGADLAATGVQRPTTAHALAAVRGEGAEPLLDWLGVRDRHRLGPAEPRKGRSLAPAPPADGGLVLLDLPDHDSVVAEHRVRAERLVERADLLVWVVDPQKYADAALHERYLRPLAGHGDVTVLVLNHADRLDGPQRAAVLADLRRLAADDGLRDVRTLALSARTGEGVDELRDLLDRAAARRRAATDRMAADLRAAAALVLADVDGDARAGRGRSAAVARASGGTTSRLVTALEQAAGVPQVTEAVRLSAIRAARARTGWPPVRWLARLRPDPLRRLHLGPVTVRPGGAASSRSGRRGDSAAEAPDLVPTSLPGPTPVATAAVANAVRGYLDEALVGAPVGWTLAARDAVRTEALPDELDRAVAATPLLGSRPALWWRALGAAQWALLAAAVAGLAWLGALALAGYLRLPEIGVPMWGPIPAPTALAVGGLLAGALLALLAVPLGRVGARRRAAAARRRMGEAISAVATSRVVEPVGAELAALRTCREQAARAASR